MIKLSSSALTQAVPDIKVCKTLVLTISRLYFSLPASAQPNPGINLKGRCKRRALGVCSGCRDKLHMLTPTDVHTRISTHPHPHSHARTRAHTYTCVYI